MTDLPQMPDTDLAQEALALAQESELPAILNHSMRTFVYASLAVEPNMDPGDSGNELLFVACALHDIGTADRFNGPQRFEVEGADAAATYLAGKGCSQEDVDRVWEAIALHTSPGIAERRGPLTRLTRLGVLADFGQSRIASSELKQALEHRYPRLEIEKVLADAVVAQAITKPDKAPRSSWPGGLLCAHLANPRSDTGNAAF